MFYTSVIPGFHNSGISLPRGSRNLEFQNYGHLEVCESDILKFWGRWISDLPASGRLHFWGSGIPEFQNADIPEVCESGIPDFWNSGIPAFWDSSNLTFRHPTDVARSLPRSRGSTRLQFWNSGNLILRRPWDVDSRLPHARAPTRMGF